MRALERILDDPNWEARDRRTRCFEHVLHLAGKAFIEAIGPTNSQSRARTTTTNAETDPLSEDEDAGGSAELDEEWFFELVDVAEHVGADDSLDFDPGDVLGKLLALINQVCRLGFVVSAHAYVLIQDPSLPTSPQILRHGL